MNRHFRSNAFFRKTKICHYPQLSECIMQDFPIVFCRLVVVHWAVYMRTLGSVHVFTAQCTHVRWAVDDEKSAKSNWDYVEKELNNGWLNDFS